MLRVLGQLQIVLGEAKWLGRFPDRVMIRGNSAWSNGKALYKSNNITIVITKQEVVTTLPRFYCKASGSYDFDISGQVWAS